MKPFTDYLERGACRDCSTPRRVVFHHDGCPFNPSACAACGARWVEDRGDRTLIHSEECEYLKALS